MTKMRRLVSLLLVGILVSSLMILPANAAASFPDTPSWCAAAINEMASQGILSGFQDGTFKPDQSMTRAQMAKVLQLIYVPEIDEAYMTGNPENKVYLDAAEAANPGNWASAYPKTGDGEYLISFELRGAGQSPAYCLGPS